MFQVKYGSALSCHADSTSVITFTEEDSLRELAVHFAKIQPVVEDVWSDQLVASDTTPHVYRKPMLEIIFYCSMCTARSP
jgi:hypothetical protein